MLKAKGIMRLANLRLRNVVGNLRVRIHWEGGVWRRPGVAGGLLMQIV